MQLDRKKSMPFETFTQDSFSTYSGIRVGFKATSISIAVAKLLKKLRWERAFVEYDLEKELIRFKKAPAAAGYVIKWGSIQARVGRVMPNGRYELIKSGQKELLFKKII